jgi:hypothetical protein
MKPILCLIVSSLLLSGCLRYPTTGPTYDRLANLPTEPHERKVKILFPGDPLPTGRYVKLGVVEVHGGGFSSYNALIRELQGRAQTLGVDVVQLFDRKYMEDTYTAWDDRTTTDVYSNLAGIGFISLADADYLSDYVSEKEIYLYRDSIGWQPEPVCRVVPSYNDQPPKITGEKNYADFVSAYSLEHLRYEETPNWTYYLNERGLVNRRTYRTGGVVVKRCRFTYERGRVTEVRIRHFYPRQLDEKVIIRYNEHGHIAEQRIFQEGSLVYREVPAYDAQERWAGSEYYVVKEGGADRPYLKVVYRFFDPSSLPADGALVDAQK